MATSTDILEPEVDQQDQQPTPPPSGGPGQQPPAKPQAQAPGALKDEDKQQLYKIVTKMEQSGEAPETIRAAVKRFQEIKTAPVETPVQTGIRNTDQSLNQPLQFNGTFKPDLEGEKKGLYLNDPDYQAQKKDFTNRIAADKDGYLLYPIQDDKTGKYTNYYTGKPIPDFDSRELQGKILQVPDKFLPATNGKKFISPVYDKNSNSYSFPGVQTPDVPTEQNLPQATVYGAKKPLSKEGDANQPKPIQAILNESDKQGGAFRNVLAEHPELSGDIVNTLKKYGPEYSQSLQAGSQGMANVLQKTVEDKYNLNKPLPPDVRPEILNGHLNVLNNFEKNKNEFEAQQNELQHQADLITDRSKRTGQPVNQDDADALAKKAANNLQRWNAYKQSVNFSQNYVNQPEVKNFLSEFQNRQKGLSLLDELRQRSFPDDTNAAIKHDEYDRKAIEGNTGVLDYLKTGIGKAGQGLANMGEGAMKLWSSTQPTMDPSAMSPIEKLNNNAQQFLGANLPTISGEAIQEMDKRGIGHVVNDLSSTVGGFAPYIIPGLAEEAGTAKAATFAAALSESLPTVRKEAEKQGLTGTAYNTYLAAKPLVSAAFMTLLPNIKFAKGFETDVAKSVVNGETNNVRKMLVNLAGKAVKEPGDVAHLQAMLTGTNLGNAFVNQITNGLQSSQDLQRGISRKEGLPVETTSLFDPKQTATMAIAGKILEAVPTLKNAVGDYKAGKDIAETYNHIQSNLVELAAGNSSGVSAKVDELLKKDPGNIYAQHLKNTLQDFAHAEARMPEGLEPEQKAALFSVQKEISQKQRQMAYADPVYTPHLQKNIDELNKLIPDILKDPKKANDYLKDSHNDLAETLLSPKPESDGKKTENAPDQAEGEIGKPTEGAGTTSAVAGPAPSIESNAAYRTLDYGENKGKDETPEAKEQIKQEILNDQPVGKTGEKFSDLLNRVIPAFKKSLTEDPHNTAIVTHSSVIKALHVWEEMGRPDISEIKGDKLKEFAQRYVDMKPEAEGKVHTFTGDNGNDIKVVRHGETEDNQASEFREDNTQLTDKGIKQAGNAGDNLIKETGGNIPKLISSDMPRTLHTSEIIKQKLQDHAVRIGSATQEVPRPEGSGENIPGSSERIRSGQQGNEPSGESGQPGQSSAEEKGKDAGKKGEVGGPPSDGKEDDLPFGHLDVGISHQAQMDRSAAELGVNPPERGEGITLPESVQRGKDLLKDGADVDQIAQKFKEDNKVSSDDMSIVRARYNELADATNKAYDKYGKDSEEAKKAMKDERDFYQNVVKPMQTEWSKIGVAQQGGVDLDAGSVSSINRAFTEKNGVEMTADQTEEAEKLATKVKGLEKGMADLKSKLDEAMKNKGNQTGGATFTERTKKAADIFRKLKTKEFTFKDSKGNDIQIQKMGVSWNDLVELGAKAIEKTGQIADGIAAILDRVKDADWYQSLSKDDQNRFGKEFEDHYTGVADQKTATRIKVLEKQLEDLQSGNVKTKGATREPTAREKELKEQIFEAKQNLGLIKPKAVPKAPVTPIEPMSLAQKFSTKRDDVFSQSDAKEVWDYMKDTYLDKNTAFGDALRNTATDLGLNAKQVLKALATPKGGKEMTTEMFKKDYERRKALEFAKRFVDAGNDSAARKFFRSLPSVFFNLKTYGHGTVGNITHAGPNIFRPSVWGSYWPNVLKSFSLAYGKVGNYQKAVTLLKSSPNFTEWKQAGLAVDPNESYDEYQVFGKKQSWLGEAGTRGFTGLKFMRYDMAETFYNRASESERADPNLRQEIAKLVNHATGHTEIKVSKTIKAITFAPGLEVSRWQRMIGDPATAMNTVVKSIKGTATPSEQAAAKIVFAGMAQKLATYSALLATNAGLLSALGSKQTVNTTDPTKSDWLKFKMSGKTLDLTGGVLNPLRLLSTLVKESYLSMYGDKKDLRTKPTDKDATTLFQQARYKLSPLAGDVADVATGTDAMGNVEPWSNIKPSAGRHKMDWFEYGTQQLPIPLAAGIKAVTDGMSERGMSKPEINDILNGALQFSVEGFTGAKLNDDYSLQQGGSGGGAGAGGSYSHRQRPPHP